MSAVMGILVGIGLSATCGFRVFVPLLGVSIAAHSGYLELAKGFAWLGSTPALIALSVATAVEICGYYLPWLDNLLDTITTPAAVIAGTIITAAMVGDLSPWLQWSLAVIAGGGAAGSVQSATVLTRGASSATTGGLGNPVIATVELITSVVSTLLIICLPLLSILFLALLGYVVIKKRKKRLATEKNSANL